MVLDSCCNRGLVNLAGVFHKWHFCVGNDTKPEQQINQSTNQSIDRSLNRSIDRSIKFRIHIDIVKQWLSELQLNKQIFCIFCNLFITNRIKYFEEILYVSGPGLNVHLSRACLKSDRKPAERQLQLGLVCCYNGARRLVAIVGTPWNNCKLFENGIRRKMLWW